MIMLLLLNFAHAQYPDKALTPGVIDCTLTTRYLCSHSTKERRNVTTAMKKAVCESYGGNCSPGGQEIDHFVPLTLGGKNDVKNLWPEPYTPTPGAHEKDALEMYLHLAVCSSRTSLYDAQEAIRNDWVKAWKLMKAKKPLAPKPSGKVPRRCRP